MTSAAYITWCFRMATIEDKHDKFRNGYLRHALQHLIKG